jgi:hypothetical protein
MSQRRNLKKTQNETLLYIVKIADSDILYLHSFNFIEIREKRSQEQKK